MSKLVSISAVLGIAMSSAILISSPCLAEQMKFKADMSASQVVPPNDSAGKGNAHVTFDTVSRRLSWTIEYSDLTGPVKAGHFHGPAGPGENAGVEVPLTKLKSPIEGSATLAKDQAKALLDGKFYVNLHTAAHPDGEIRGQVVKAKM
jgi:hypothetical protein